MRQRDKLLLVRRLNGRRHPLLSPIGFRLPTPALARFLLLRAHILSVAGRTVAPFYIV